MISPCFPFLSTASLRVVGQEGHTPLPVRKSVGKPFVQGWTHTHTAPAAVAFAAVLLPFGAAVVLATVVAAVVAAVVARRASGLAAAVGTAVVAAAVLARTGRA